MKKITSFLMMVLFSVVTFAQAVNPITSLDQLKNDAVYTIKSSRCFLLYTSELPNMLCTSTGSQVPASAKEYNPADANQQFRIEQHDGNYYLFSIGANKYVNQDGNYVAFNEAAVLTIREQAPGEAYAWYMQLNDYGMNSQIANQTSTGIILNSWTTPDAGNVFEIADIDVSNIDPFEAPYNALSSKYDAITNAIDIEELKEGVNVGTFYGNYKQDITDYFLAKNAAVESVIVTYNTGGGLASVKETFATVEDLNALTDSYQQAYDSLRTNTVARAMKEITAGYYTINSAVTFVKPHTTYTYWTEEEAQEWNDSEGLEPGAEGFAVAGELKDSTTTQVQSLKAIYDQNGKASWKEIENKADFLFWIEPTNNDSVPTYKIINKLNNLTLKPIRQSTHAELEVCDTAQFVIDYYGEKTLADGTTPKVAIRNVITANAEGVKTGISTESGYNYMHAGGHSYSNDEQVGKGLAGTVVGWTHTDCSYWYLAPVDEETALAWIEAASPVKKVRAMVDFADSIAAAFPAQLEIAKDTIDVNDGVVVTNPDQFYSNAAIIDGTNGLSSAPATAEDTYALLLDGNHGTFFHTDWAAGAVGVHAHYLQIESTEPLEGLLAVEMSRRNGAANDHPTQFAVVAYEENNPDLGYEDGDSIATLYTPFVSNTETVVSNLFEGRGYKVFRFYWEDSNGGTDRGYWHASEFNIVKNPRKETKYEKTQYQVRYEEAVALEAAVAAWNEAGYDRENGELLNDETFNAAYNAIVAAGAAWGEVYVDPTALRTAIAAVPTNIDDLFPIGTNPGQWSSHDNIKIAETAARAQTYDESGAYTPAESEAHIEAIANAEEVAYASANQVQTGVWYRFTFPGQDLYETFGWDKSGPSELYSTGAHSQTKIQTTPNLWNKIVASGSLTYVFEHEVQVDGETYVDTVTQRLPVIVDEAFRENQGVYFFSKEELEVEGAEGIDLFRFIQATDSSYMIQHKASGLFLQAGYSCVLSPIPSYFHSKAMGAGANLIAWTDVLGNVSTGGNNPSYKYKYLHAQRSDGALTTWNSENLGSNSMINIEAVSEVTADEIAAIPTTYIKWMWPGYIYDRTYPVDITIVEGEDKMDDAVAYGADLNVTETDITVVLRPVAAGVTIKAGTPFFLVTNPELIGSEEYESTTDAQTRLIAEFNENSENENEYNASSEDYNWLNSELESMYAWVMMEHGMEVDTTLKQLGNSLRGSLEPIAVKAGKIMTASENGFSLLASDATLHPNHAYIPCDFEKGTDISGLVIDLNGASIETAINEVLNKVAQGGNIYTVGGQLVGKGNINTVNNLPAGIYIVNGVKVTKR